MMVIEMSIFWWMSREIYFICGYLLFVNFLTKCFVFDIFFVPLRLSNK